MLTISNERIDMETTGIDWSKVNMEEELRGLSNERKVERRDQHRYPQTDLKY